MKKNILLVGFFVCLFSLSLMGQEKTLDEMLEKYKGKDGISQIKSLLDRGINAQDNSGRTALNRASWYGHTEIVRILIQAGAQVNIKDDDGDTALYWASYKGYTEVVRLLKAAGAR